MLMTDDIIKINEETIETEDGAKVIDGIEQEDHTKEEVITTPFSPSDIKISNPPMNMGDLIDMLSFGWINLQTEYQREMNLWSPVQQSRLIESVLLGLRLPAFYFEVVDKHNWNIIDGLQRCCAIKNFCVDEMLTLEGLEFLDNFNGKTFEDFRFDTKRDIRMLPITVNLLEKGVPDQVKYILFKRLNTGGIELTSQEIRNAVFNGPVIDLVRDMAQEPSFTLATDHRVPTKRHVDMDFVSRFIAFYWLDFENYEPDLDSYINKSMADIRDNGTESRVEKMRRDFRSAMKLAYDIFGNRAFRKQQKRDEYRRPLNKAYFEVIASRFALLDEEKQRKLLDHKELFVDNLHTAMRESFTYRNSFSGGTGNRDAVRWRFTSFNKILDMTCQGETIRVTDDNKIESIQL